MKMVDLPTLLVELNIIILDECDYCKNLKGKVPR